MEEYINEPSYKVIKVNKPCLSEKVKEELNIMFEKQLDSILEEQSKLGAKTIPNPTIEERNDSEATKVNKSESSNGVKEFPDYSFHELDDTNLHQANEWMESGNLVGFVSVEHDEIIAYSHRDHADFITTSLNLPAVKDLGKNLPEQNRKAFLYNK